MISGSRDSKKRQEIPIGLWMVATPIGNLMDMTPRASLALETADFILCEDTRVGGKLLSALQLAPKGKLKRFDHHSSALQAKSWVDKIHQGQSIAFISDAGTPGVSDPGALLVREAYRQNVRVVPVSGVSAVSSLVSVLGAPEPGFWFRGFFPRVPKKQKEELAFFWGALEQEVEKKSRSEDVVLTGIWFESPHRILPTLEFFSSFLDAKGSDFEWESEVLVAKELTKIFEKLFEGSIKNVIDQVSDEIAQNGEVGEWCFSVRIIGKRTQSQEKIQAEISRTLRCFAKVGVSVKDAVRVISQEFGEPRKKVYGEALRIFQKE